MWASSLSSESPHLSASSGVGLQMKAERFFNKPISARFLIVWPIRRTLLGRWEEMQLQTRPLSLTASFHSVSSLSHSALPREWSQQREPWVCSTVVVGGGFYSCIQCNLEGSGGGEWLQPANEDAQPPTYMGICLPPAASHFALLFLYPAMKYAFLTANLSPLQSTCQALFGTIF